MARGVNKTIHVGFLGADPEIRYTPSGTAITTIRVATSESWKDKQSGEMQERTEWHAIRFYGRLAEVAGEYLKKGRQVYVEGKLRTDEYEKDGVKRYTTYIVGEEMQMLGSRADESGRDNAANDKPIRARKGKGKAKGTTTSADEIPPDLNDLDGDVPF